MEGLFVFIVFDYNINLDLGLLNNNIKPIKKRNKKFPPKHSPSLKGTIYKFTIN